MNVNISAACDRFINEYKGKYFITDAKIHDEEIWCIVSSIKSIGIIPLYYLGHKIKVVKK
jgi:hypothetical protein